MLLRGGIDTDDDCRNLVSEPEKKATHKHFLISVTRVLTTDTLLKNSSPSHKIGLIGDPQKHWGWPRSAGCTSASCSAGRRRCPGRSCSRVRERL
jgi:hypothetical protein